MKAPFPCRPTFIVASFGDIDPQLIKQYNPGLKALTHDIDGYMMDHDDPIDGIPAAHLEVIRQAGEVGFLQAIISNTGHGPRADRSNALAQYIREAADLEDLPVINSSMPGCSKKPDASMFLEAAKVLGVDPSEICHGGDQMLKDVMGANRAGCGATILTPRYGDNDHIGVRIIQRPAEAALGSALNLPQPIEGGMWIGGAGRT